MRIPRRKVRKAIGKHWYCMVVPCGLLFFVSPLAGLVALGLVGALAWVVLR